MQIKVLTAITCFEKNKVDTFIKLLSILSWLKYFLAVIKKHMIQVNF